MTSLNGRTATLRRRLIAALTATGLGGATAVVLLSAPSAVGASDPCTSSEIAKAISNVARSAGDYLDGHPETNQAMTSALQQSAHSQSLDSLGIYLSANPKAASDLQTIALPLAGLSSRCQTPPISLPQVLGFAQPAPVSSPGTGSSAQGVVGSSAAPSGSGAAAIPDSAVAMPGVSAVK